MATLAQIDLARRMHESEILALPNVVGVGTGPKIVRNTRTNELVIKVYVVRKLSPKELKRDETIPPVLRISSREGTFEVRTDVVETGEIKLLASASRAIPYTFKKRPVPPGYQIGWWNADTRKFIQGTIGLWVVDANRKIFLLSNNHVIVDSNQYAVDVLQPAKDSEPDSRIGETSLFAVISTTQSNYMDAAIALPDKNSLVNVTYPRIGAIKGHYNEQNMWNWHFRKVGMTTGLTSGKVEDMDVTTTCNFPGVGKIFFAGQIRLTSESTLIQSGDSGSVMISDDNYAGILLHAESDKNTAYGFPMGRVMKKFGLRVCAGVTKNGEGIPGEDVGLDIGSNELNEKTTMIKKARRRRRAV